MATACSDTKERLELARLEDGKDDFSPYSQTTMNFLAAVKQDTKGQMDYLDKLAEGIRWDLD